MINNGVCRRHYITARRRPSTDLYDHVTPHLNRPHHYRCSRSPCRSLRETRSTNSTTDRRHRCRPRPSRPRCCAAVPPRTRSHRSRRLEARRSACRMQWETLLPLRARFGGRHLQAASLEWRSSLRTCRPRCSGVCECSMLLCLSKHITLVLSISLSNLIRYAGSARLPL